MKKNAGGKLITYMLWPLLLTGLWLIMDVTLLFVSRKAALIGIIATVVYFAAVLIMLLLRRKRILRDYIAFSACYDDVESKLLTEMDIPYAVLDGESEVLWCNKAFSFVCGKKGLGMNFRELLPDVKAYTLPKHESDERTYRTRIGGKVYKIVMRAQETPEFDAQLKRISRGAGVKLTKTVSAFLYDETELTALRQENYDSRLVFGLLYIDNYDEVLDSYEEVNVHERD